VVLIIGNIGDTVPGDAVVIKGGIGDTVPGDAVVVEGGDSLPADLRIFQCHNLNVLEAMLSGESNPVGKMSDATPQERCPR
jgi:P-type E1-E2 ATPase